MNISETAYRHHEHVIDATVSNAGIDRVAYERSLDERIHIESQLRSLIGHKSTYWTSVSGFYGDTPGGRVPHVTAIEDIESPLSGLEADWARKIDAKLLHRKEQGLPVAVVDFGGGFALSLMRLADQKYEDAIQNGDLILAATNLGYTPPQDMDEDGYSGVASSLNAVQVPEGKNLFQTRKSQANFERTVEFAERHQKSVQFLDSTILELPDQSLQRVSGEPLPVRRNLDIFSERLALAHSHVPDMAASIIERDLLATNGYAYLQNSATQASVVDYARGLNGERISLNSVEYSKRRQQASELGRYILEDTPRLQSIQSGNSSSIHRTFIRR